MIKIQWPKPLLILLKILAAIICLYFFIVSLDFLSIAFRLISGRHSKSLFSNSDLLQNPIVGLMIGILITVLFQSSSTTTSILVGMVASDVLSVPTSIPMIMGANIGTSITNTIVSFTQMGEQECFEKAFASAVLHDMFNWLSVIIMLPLEILTGYLYHVSLALVNLFPFNSREEPPELLSVITKPFTDIIIQIDKKVLNDWALNSSDSENITSLLKRNSECLDSNGELYECGYLFANWGLSDGWKGLILLIISIVSLVTCLVSLVKILNSAMKAKMATVITKTLNANIPYAPWLTGYFALLIGAVITILVQSSSVFTSTLTPLVGSGLFTIERAYPLTLGSNIGTTTTGILAAMAADGEQLRFTLQLAFCHLLFNVTGILLFYPLPALRFPIFLSKQLGKVVGKYRWVSIAYLLIMFLFLPAYIFGLSVAFGSTNALLIGGLPPILIGGFASILHLLQRKKPKCLPAILQNWDFLPLCLRSLKPYDELLRKCICRSKNNETKL